MNSIKNWSWVLFFKVYFQSFLAKQLHCLEVITKERINKVTPNASTGLLLECEINWRAWCGEPVLLAKEDNMQSWLDFKIQLFQEPEM